MKFKLPQSLRKPKLMNLSPEQFQFVYTDYAMNQAFGVTRDALYESMLTEEFIGAFDIPKNQQSSVKPSLQFVLDMLDSNEENRFQEAVSGIRSQIDLDAQK